MFILAFCVVSLRARVEDKTGQSETVVLVRDPSRHPTSSAKATRRLINARKNSVVSKCWADMLKRTSVKLVFSEVALFII